MVFRFVRVLTIAAAVVSLGGCDALVGTKLYAEPNRPAYHFTPARNWINDPVGLVYFEGEYHLFFQHNPKARDWGRMSWGHAVSADLVNWRELPLAMAEREDVMIWSGSAVVDWNNTSGFGQGARPALVAAYTGYDKATGVQAQYIAYSNDRGRTWIQYNDARPVLDVSSREFRDPKLFWHEETQRWVMVVAFATDHQIAIYNSTDLKRWTEVSRFTPTDPPDGDLECPDLFKLPAPGGGERWVMALHFKNAASGTGNRYVIGDFDGRAFKPSASARMDHGADFYATQTWSDIPPTDGRRIMIGWMADITYAGQTPTKPWRGQMTAPRTLSLIERDGVLRLTQQPVAELAGLRREQAEIANLPVNGAAPLPLPFEQSGAMDIELTFVPGAGQSGLRLNYGEGREVLIGYDRISGALFVDRNNSGAAFAPGFAARHTAAYAPQGEIRLRVLVDRTSVEVFADDGAIAISDLVFTRGPLERAEAFAEGGAATVLTFSAWRMAEMDRGMTSR